jgi:hypothetical protein
MIVDIFNNCLTIVPMLDNLAVLSPHVKVGIGLPRKGEKSPLSTVVFFRPQLSTNAGLIRVKFTMVDCLRETLKSFARSFAGRPTSFNPPPMIGLIGGGKPSFKGVTAMSQNNSAQQLNTQAQIEQNQ